MPLLKLTCESCGGVLNYESKTRIGYCPYCGGKYLKEESINYNHTIVNNNNNYSGATIYNVNENSDKYIQAADVFFKEKNFNAAIEIYAKAKDANPQDYRAWWGLARSYERILLPLENKKSGDYYANALSLCKSEEERKKIDKDAKVFFQHINDFLEMEARVRQQLLDEEKKENEERRKRQNKKIFNTIAIIYLFIFFPVLFLMIYVMGTDGIIGTVIFSAIVAVVIFIVGYIVLLFG